VGFEASHSVVGKTNTPSRPYVRALAIAQATIPCIRSCTRSLAYRPMCLSTRPPRNRRAASPVGLSAVRMWQIQPLARWPCRSLIKVRKPSGMDFSEPRESREDPVRVLLCL
jgi:hypothetical protein